DLELVHVDLLAEDLLDRLDHARMSTEGTEGLVVEMGGKGGARRAALLAPHLGAIGVIDIHRLAGEEIHLFLAEQFGQEQPALAVEEFDLLRRQFHAASSFWFSVLFPLMVRSALARVSNREASVAHPSRRGFAAPQDEDCNPALITPP